MGIHLKDTDLTAVVGLTLDGMPEIHRMPLWLHYCVGFGRRETAETLLMSESALIGLLVAGMNDLQARLRSRCLGCEETALKLLLSSLQPDSAPQSLLARLDEMFEGVEPGRSRRSRRKHAGRRTVRCGTTPSLCTRQSSPEVLPVNTTGCGARRTLQIRGWNPLRRG